MTTDTRIIEHAVRNQDGWDTALGVLNVDSAVATNNELLAREDTEDEYWLVA